MGNSQSFCETYEYHAAVTPSTKGSSPVYRTATHPTELVHQYLDKPVQSAWDLFDMTVKRFPNRRFLGRRFRDADGQLREFEWLSYYEAQQISLAFGSGLLSLDRLLPEVEYPQERLPSGRKMRLLGLYAKNCVEWFLAEQACNGYNFTLCPLYDTLGDEAIEFIFTQTQMVTSLVGFENFETLLRVITDESGHKIKDNIALRNVILVNPEVADDYRRVNLQFKSAITQAQGIGLTIYMWHDIVQRGRDKILPVTPGNLDNINTLCYTSGTTGMPKGVILTHKLVTSVVIGAGRGPINPSGIFEVGPNDCLLSYLPLAHVFERSVCQIVINKGGAIGVYSGDMAKLLDDVKVLKPTVFISVPRLYNRINDRVALSLQEKNIATQMLFNRGLDSKVTRRRAESTTTHRLWDAVVFNNIKGMMGGRLRGMISGGAPIDQTVSERMTAFFGVPLMQGYGLSETFGPCFLAHPSDNQAGHIGGVWPAVEWKIVSVPELGYLVTNKPPSGELCLRGPGVACGYFLNPEETDASWDPEGWFHTGDIASIVNNTSKAIAIIDRKKNIFKLAQGEYVAPEKIEAVYAQALLIAQIFSFGYSDRTFLVGVVHPELDAARKWLTKKNGTEPIKVDLEMLCKDKSFKAAVLEEMERVAKKLGLKGFEKIKCIHLIPEPFSVENNLLTPTSKLRRAECKKAYQTEIDQMYAEAERPGNGKNGKA